MKRGIFTFTVVSLAAISTGHAASLIDTFDAYTGTLAGQGGWTQNATNATNPITVTGGKVALAAVAGQDDYINFSSSIPATDGTFAYYGLTLNVSSATATGEYFAHFTSGLLNPTLFSGRLGAKTGSVAGTFLLGYSESTVAGFSYGTADLTLGTDYRVIVRYGFVGGALNDTGAVFVTPVATPFDPIEGNNTPYVTDVYNGATGEIGAFTGFQLRQGAAANSPALVIDDLVVTSNFSEAIAAPVPEPSAFLSVISGVGMLTLVRRRR